MYRYAHLLLDPDDLHRLRQQYPLYLVVVLKQLHGYANPLFEYHLVEHVLRQPRLHLLFLRVLHGHADTLLEPHLDHVRFESWLLLLLFLLCGHPHPVQPAIHDHLFLESGLLPRYVGIAHTPGPHGRPAFRFSPHGPGGTIDVREERE